jgi:recombination protein RecA
MAKKTNSLSTVIEKKDKANRDELAKLIVDAVNKASKSGTKTAYFLDEHEDPATITDWVSTGSSILDLAISNRANCGLPSGRIVLLEGLESTGKSLICAHIIANTQKRGGYGAMIDTESAAAPEFWTALGVDITNLPYLHINTVEDIFSNIELCIGAYRKANKTGLFTLIVDSLAAASTEVEMESDHGKDGYNTAKAIIISKGLRKITGLIAEQKVLLVFTNQLRYNLNAGPFGDKFISPSAKALAYHCSVKVRLKKTGNIKKDDKIIGVNVQAKVEKTRFGPPFRTADFNVFFDSGISDISSWLTYMKDNGIVSQGGAYFSYTRNNGDELKLMSKDFVTLINSDAEFRNEIYNKISDNYIMKYKSPNSEIKEDVEVISDSDENDVSKKDGE